MGNVWLLDLQVGSRWALRFDNWRVCSFGMHFSLLVDRRLSLIVSLERVSLSSWWWLSGRIELSLFRLSFRSHLQNWLGFDDSGSLHSWFGFVSRWHGRLASLLFAINISFGNGCRGRCWSICDISCSLVYPRSAPGWQWLLSVWIQSRCELGCSSCAISESNFFLIGYTSWRFHRSSVS